MNLIINLGNSDLKIISPDGKDFIFRNRSKFKEHLQLLIDAIDNSNPEFDQDGKVIGHLTIKNDEKSINVLKLDFILLKSEISQIEKMEKTKIEKVTCFLTHQEDNGSDTFLFKSLLEGKVGKQIFPGVVFSFVEITCNPSDYSLVIPIYQNYFNNLKTKNISIVIAQGTPAMCVGLSMVAAKKSVNIHQFYAKHVEKDDSVKVVILNQFSQQEKEKQKYEYLDLMKRGEFLTAFQKIDGTILEEISGLKEITNYFINRSNYCFKEALNNLSQIKNSKFKNIIDYGKDSLEQILSCFLKDEKGKINFNYHFDNFPFVLKETLSNIKFEFKKQNYFLGLALLTSFMDCLERTIICVGLDLPNMDFDFKTNSYPALDAYIHNNIDMNSISKNEYKDFLKKWRIENGKRTLKYTGVSAISFIKWIGNFKPNTNFACIYSEINRKVCLQNIRTLRNQLPIAHSVSNVSKEIILSKLENLSIEEFLNMFDKVLLELFCLGSVPDFFKDYHESLIDIENIVMDY